MTIIGQGRRISVQYCIQKIRASVTRSRPSTHENDTAPGAVTHRAPLAVASLLLDDGKVADMDIEIVVHAQPHESIRAPHVRAFQCVHLHPVHLEAN